MGEGAVFLAALVVGYLAGSIPFGLLLARAAGLGDVREIGSGNIGATNVLRTGSKTIAALTLLCDALKGTIPTALALAWAGDLAGLAAAYGAFLGHVLPVWLGFKGGKGVATFLGILFGLHWPLGLLFVLGWLIVAWLFRLSSLAALVASFLMPVAAAAMSGTRLALGLAVLALAILLTHRSNIVRLLRGEEPKINFGSRAAC
jgi:glycerol-3-phosphate acyltransferase PlsY